MKAVDKYNHTGLFSEDLKVVGNNHYTDMSMVDSKVVGNNYCTGSLQEEAHRRFVFVGQRLRIHSQDTVLIVCQQVPSLLCCTRCISHF